MAGGLGPGGGFGQGPSQAAIARGLRVGDSCPPFAQTVCPRPTGLAPNTSSSGRLKGLDEVEPNDAGPERRKRGTTAGQRPRSTRS